MPFDSFLTNLDDAEIKFTPNMTPKGVKNHIELRIWQGKDDECLSDSKFPPQHWHYELLVWNGSFSYSLDHGTEPTPEQAASVGVQALKVFTQRLNQEGEN